MFKSIINHYCVRLHIIHAMWQGFVRRNNLLIFTNELFFIPYAFFFSLTKSDFDKYAQILDSKFTCCAGSGGRPPLLQDIRPRVTPQIIEICIEVVMKTLSK